LVFEFPPFVEYVRAPEGILESDPSPIEFAFDTVPEYSIQALGLLLSFTDVTKAPCIGTLKNASLTRF